MFNIQVKKSHYFRKKYDDLNRFISYYYQIDLVQQVLEADRRRSDSLRDTQIHAEKYQRGSVFAAGLNQRRSASILEVGKGNGTVSDYFKKLGCQVTTCDIDQSLEPDYLADIRKLPFKNNEFDVVTVFEVLEHLPWGELPKALLELRRVSKKYVVVSLPYRSTGFEIVLHFPLIRKMFKRSFFDLFLRLPLTFGGIKTSGQHHWEIDAWRYSLAKVRCLIGKYFRIVKEIRPVLNHYHYFFVLEKI